MKKYYILLIILSLFFYSCKTKTEEKKIINSQLIIKKEKKNHDISICDDKKQEKELFTKLSKNNKINPLKELNSKFYYAISKNKFNTLFNGNQIKCVVPFKSKKYSYFTIYYKENQISKEVFEKIKKLEKNNENLNKYHDFFKRGLVFILNTKENNITLISFNMFSDNSLPRKVENFFSTNKKSFESVFMTTGLGYVQIFVE